MKNIILLAVSCFMFSCTTHKVLKTDTKQDIDLSGRWNDTDAEIASSELFNSLLSSNWFKSQQGENNLKPRIEIIPFEDNFNADVEKLAEYFAQYITKDSSLELIVNRKEKVPEFQLTGEIWAEEFISETQDYIDYRLTAQLKNMDGEIQWEDNTVIKKYIKD